MKTTTVRFVKRPKNHGRGGAGILGPKMKALIATALNGKSVVWTGPGLGGVRRDLLRRRGLRATVAKQSNGTYRAWCERLAGKP